MKVSLVSLEQKWEDKKSNRVLCEKFVSLSAKENVDIIIFPEMTLTGFSTNVDLIAEDVSHSETLMYFQDLSQKYAVAIIFGVVINAMIYVKRQYLGYKSEEKYGNVMVVNAFAVGTL